MARYQITLAYDGTEFEGFQRQGKKRTVQAVLEQALCTLGWQGKSLLAAGRTDRGVHASGQVAAFDLEWAHSAEDLGRALNSRVPKDVAIKEIHEAPATFHPRFDALARTYQYHIYCESDRDPLKERYAWRIWPEPDGTMLSSASLLLSGYHDFAAFGSPPTPKSSTSRVIYRAEWQLEQCGWCFTICGNAFLYHMVRRLVYLQGLVGHQRISLTELDDGIKHQQSLIPGIAPANGLFLTEVRYVLNEQENAMLMKLKNRASGEVERGKDVRHKGKTGSQMGSD